METDKSTENVTVIPADLYDELTAETMADDELRAAAERARGLVVKR